MTSLQGSDKEVTVVFMKKTLLFNFAHLNWVDSSADHVITLVEDPESSVTPENVKRC